MIMILEENFSVGVMIMTVIKVTMRMRMRIGLKEIKDDTKQVIIISCKSSYKIE